MGHSEHSEDSEYSEGSEYSEILREWILQGDRLVSV